ncbi:MAG TPA: ATP-dependent Clp protease proteolytic subunit [bacterium]|nr:ATP-dependent Clp protease proteolytic subunit [bacterium]
MADATISNQTLMDNGIIYVPSSIDEEMANKVTQAILLINAADSTRQINLYINSPGGSVFETLAIYDVMRIVTNPVATYCIGTALSAAAVLLASGDKGKRYATPHSRILLHQVWRSSLGGRTEDVKVAARLQESLEHSLIDILAEHTGQDKDKIKKDMTFDFWLTAQEALEYGIIDEIISYSIKADQGKVTSES